MASATTSSRGSIPESWSTPQHGSLHSTLPSQHYSHTVGLPFVKSGGKQVLSCKSLPDLPAFEVPSFNSEFDLDTSASLGEKSSLDGAERGSSANRRLTSNWVQDAAVAERPKSWFQLSRLARRAAVGEGSRSTTSLDLKRDTVVDGMETKTSRQPLPSRASFAGFSRRSWADLSRASSQPDSHDALPQTNKAYNPSITNSPSENHQQYGRTSSPTEVLATITPNKGENVANRSLNRASTYFNRAITKPTMPFSKLGKGYSSDDSCTSSNTSLSTPLSHGTATRVSQSISDENESVTTEDSSVGLTLKARDPQWSILKSLDSDIRTFSMKSSEQKTAYIHQVLLPTVREKFCIDSLWKLSTEDIEHRSEILHKWWQVILDEMDRHDGPRFQTLESFETALLMDVATMIMARPEWRQLTTYHQPLLDRSPTERVGTRRHETSARSSLSSDTAEFSAKSAEHNVRTMFVSSLLRQVGHVVRMMASRYPSAEVISFTGMTCAYAFFFAPGLADVLVRHWGLSREQIRRTAKELGLPTRDKGESEDIVSLFPPHLSRYGWTSPTTLWNQLKQTDARGMPTQLLGIPWTRSWVSRWKGRDTSLFLTFYKHYHVLSDQFTPRGLPLVERSRAPAFALVQAQLLAVLDSMIRCQPPPTPLANPMALSPAKLRGINVAAGPDLPLPPANVVRSASENTVIIMLRELCADEAPEDSAVVSTVAEAVLMMLRASATSTQQFDSAACFNLCDLLEEILTLCHGEDGARKPQIDIDWNFWFIVCRRILQSAHTMSEIRVLSLIHVAWNAITSQSQRKEQWVIGWLISEEVFNEFFNHWSPMVRAYYHRLLCWRVCRDSGSLNQLDSDIFLIVAERLRTAWNHYTFLQQGAVQNDRLPQPCTAPVFPSPGKRFVIIREEAETPRQSPLFGRRASFSSILSSGSLLEAESDDTQPKSDGKRRWSLLSKVLTLASGAYAEDSLEESGQGMLVSNEPQGSARGGPPLPPKAAVSEALSGSRPRNPSSSMTVDQKHSFKFFLGWQQQQASQGNLALSRPRLPAPAQARIRSRNRSDSSPPAPGLPADTRIVSGSARQGLVHEAKNAGSNEVSNLLPRTSPQLPSVEFMTTFDTILGGSGSGPKVWNGTALESCDGATEQLLEHADSEDGTTVSDAVKPIGIYVKTAVYAGRALAEWSLVVLECNNFVERRRQEGVLGLGEMEVPLLGVESFRKLCI